MDLFQFNQKKKTNFKMMGVINITPNSFSDGGRFTTASSIKNQIDHFRKYDCKIFDFGAESTAPFNGPISFKEEQERLRPLIELIKDGEFREDEVLSFDTYKLDTFEWIISLINSLGLKNRIIFNDISGVLDEGLFSLMDKYSFDYVFSHSLVPSREESSHHMNYISEDLDIVTYFEQALLKFSSRDFSSRVYLDPCFGFSKTADQNLDLIGNIESWIPCSTRWVLGVSRKSFLRKLSIEEDMEQQIEFSELLHGQILSSWMRGITDREVIIRLHDPKVFHSALLIN